MLIFLLACEAGSAVGEGGIDTSELFPVEDGAFSAFRHFTASEYAEAVIESDLDETDLVFGRFAAGGCAAGEGWRMELRRGGEWSSASALGALHFDEAGGLAVCGYEDAAGALAAYDPPVSLWVDGTPLTEDEPLATGEWTVTPTREEELSTYFGVFTNSATFTLVGPGAVNGWVLHLAARYGVVMMVNGDFTADLVYTR